MLRSEGYDSASDVPWTKQGKAMLGVARTPRVDNVIDTAARMAMLKGQDLSCMFCDISQSVSRKPWSSQILRALNTSTEFYSFGLDRVILMYNRGVSVSSCTLL